MMNEILSEEDYFAVMRRIDVLMDDDPELHSPEGEELERLCLLVEQYEQEG